MSPPLTAPSSASNPSSKPNSTDMLRRPVPPPPDRFSGSLAPNAPHHHTHSNSNNTAAVAAAAGAKAAAAAAASSSIPRRFSLRSIKRRSKSRIHDNNNNNNSNSNHNNNINNIKSNSLNSNSSIINNADSKSSNGNNSQHLNHDTTHFPTTNSQSTITSVSPTHSSTPPSTTPLQHPSTPLSTDHNPENIDSTSTFSKRGSFRSATRHRSNDRHKSIEGEEGATTATTTTTITTDASSLEHSAQLDQEKQFAKNNHQQHAHHQLHHHPHHQQHAHQMQLQLEQQLQQQPLAHLPHGHSHMPLSVVGTERYQPAPRIHQNHNHHHHHNNHNHLSNQASSHNSSQFPYPAPSTIPTVPTVPRPRRMMFFREEGVMRVAHRKERNAAIIPSHVDPLALIRNMPVKAEGWLYIAVHAAPGLSQGPIAKWVFRRNVMKRFAQLRGSVVVLYMNRNDPVREIFSPVGCAVSSADTVVNRRGTVEHNVNIAKNGFTIQLRLKSEADADLWAAVLRDVSMVRQPRLSDFNIIAPIGEGASGKVFLVRDTKTGKKLALKCMNKRNESSLGFSPSEFRHAVDERLAHEHMNNADFIVKLRHAFQTKDRFYLATEFCEGGDVYNFVDMRGGGVTEDQAKIITAQVLLGLRSLHKESIVFRDLKPENVLLDRDGRVRLADFGLCKLLDQSKSLTRTVCGTFSYAAAEILEESGYGLSCDLWALGTFLYHIMIGRPPRVAASLEEARTNIFNSKEPIIWYSDVMSEEAMSLVTALIEVNPTQRLGCGLEGIWEVSRHPFFRDVDWDGLEQGRIPPVVTQELPPEEEGDLRNFNQDEWRSIRMDADQDVPAFTESVLWPLRNLTTHPLPNDFLVSYAYSCETLTTQVAYNNRTTGV